MGPNKLAFVLYQIISEEIFVASRIEPLLYDLQSYCITILQHTPFI